MYSRFEHLLITVWVGMLLTVGYIAAPVVFSQLDDRALAGNVVGAMLHVGAMLGFVCGGLLLIGGQWFQKNKPRFRSQRILIVTMLALVAMGQFVLTPMMSELRATGIIEGSDEAQRFAWLHGVAAVIYLVTSLLGLRLVWTQTMRE